MVLSQIDASRPQQVYIRPDIKCMSVEIGPILVVVFPMRLSRDCAQALRRLRAAWALGVACSLLVVLEQAIVERPRSAHP